MNVSVLEFGSVSALHAFALSESYGVFVTAQILASPEVGKVGCGVNCELYLAILLIRVGPISILLAVAEFPEPPMTTPLRELPFELAVPVQLAAFFPPT